MRIAPVLFSILVFSISSFSQSLIFDDFEGNGNISSWFGDDCTIDVAFNNPVSQGLNTSSTVLKYQDIGGLYANAQFDVSTNFDMSTDHIFSLLIYVPSNGLTGNQPNQVSLKLQDGTIPDPWTTQSEIIVPIVLDQWQTVTFDFLDGSFINLDPTSLPPTQRTDFNRVVIQVNGENNTDHVLAYIDDVRQDSSSTTPPNFNNLVWADEFNGSGMIDTSKWFHQTQLPIPGSWFNGEIQHYTNRTDNSILGNGNLSIIAKKETFTDQGHTKQYTSARLNSKFAFTYGRVEVRAKLPTGVGTWPAIWMLGQNIAELGGYWDNEGYGTLPWPACGEIDIMEHWGHNQNYISSALHTPSSFGGTVNVGGQTIPTVSTDFHVYELEWTADKMVFSVDGVVHYTYNPPVKNAQTWPFDDPQYILLNIAIEPSIDPNFTQSSMDIDYVRVYQESAVSIQEENAPLLNTYPNPFNDQIFLQFNQQDLESLIINLYAANGQRIEQFTKHISGNSVQIDGLQDLPSGLYVLMYTLDDEVHAVKLMKE
jgi:beta-glucanase (GH16 family)